MARRVGVSKDTMQRVWSARGLKPQLVKTFKLSNDPLFEDGVRLRRRGQTIGSRAARPARRDLGTKGADVGLQPAVWGRLTASTQLAGRGSRRRAVER